MIGADVHIAPDLDESLASGIVPTLNRTRYFLLEPPHHILPPKLEEMTARLIKAGFLPIITHPERLTWLKAHYGVIENLNRMGCLIQVTADSITGGFGKDAQYLAHRLLDEGRVDIIATDCHGPVRRRPVLTQARQAVADRLGENEASAMVVERPSAILENRVIAPVGSSREGASAERRDKGVGTVQTILRRRRDLTGTSFRFLLALGGLSTMTASVAGCSSASGPVGPGSTDALQLASTGSTEGGLSVVRDLPSPGNASGGSDQPLSPGDVLEVDVFQVDNLDRTVQIDASGRISLPLVGSVTAGGVTLRDLEQEVERAYGAQYLQSPDVTIFVKESAGQRVTVDGEVMKAGIYPVTGDASLLDAVALAGGFQDNRRSHESVRLSRHQWPEARRQL